MGHDLLDDRDARCPGCGAGARADAPWCTQCYRRLRPTGAVLVDPCPAPVAAGAPTGPGRPAVPVLPAGADAPAATWPCASCGTATPISEAVCAGCGTGFLSDLRTAEPPLLVLPLVGDVSALGRGQRLLAALAVVAGLLLVALALGLLLP